MNYFNTEYAGCARLPRSFFLGYHLELRVFLGPNFTGTSTAFASSKVISVTLLPFLEESLLGSSRYRKSTASFWTNTVFFSRHLLFCRRSARARRSQHWRQQLSGTRWQGFSSRIFQTRSELLESSRELRSLSPWYVRSEALLFSPAPFVFFFNPFTHKLKKYVLPTFSREMYK